MPESIPQRGVTTRYGRGVEGNVRIVARGWTIALLVSGAIACSGSENGGGGDAPCPAGTTEQTAINELAGDGSETREDAIRAELRNIGLEASDEEIAAGVIAAEPGGDVGSEEVRIETEGGGVATMTLQPLEPGWGVERTSWCEPA
jgi:hypothetical protein